MTDQRPNRRRLLALLGSGLATGLAGCSGGNGGATATPTATPTATSGAEGVPVQYETATSIGGVQRDPDSLSSQSAVSYQSQPKDGQQCSDCQFYIEDKNGDGMGACAIVAGTISPEGYCVSYAEYQG